VSSFLYVDKYKDGTVSEEVLVVDGKRQGLCTRYCMNGRVMAHENFVNDVLHGEARFYSSLGKLKWCVLFVRGKPAVKQDHLMDDVEKFEYALKFEGLLFIEEDFK